MMIKPGRTLLFGERQRVSKDVRQAIQLNVFSQDSKNPGGRFECDHAALLAYHFAGCKRVNPVAGSGVDEGHPRRKNLLQIIQFRFVVFAKGKNQFFDAPPVRRQEHLYVPSGQAGDRRAPQ